MSSVAAAPIPRLIKNQAEQYGKLAASSSMWIPIMPFFENMGKKV